MPCLIEIVEKPGEKPYLLYREDNSRKYPGGLKGRKTIPKTVIHHSNSDNPDRCFVFLFKQYRQLCPGDPVASAFYLQPSCSPSDTCLFTRQPLGHSTLGGTVARLCKQADIDAYKTNHSPQATATAKLYHYGVEEQLIEKTGHHSLEGVRLYKHTSDQQWQAVSNRNESPASSTRTRSPVFDSRSITILSQQQLGCSLSLISASFKDCRCCSTWE